MDKTSRAGTLHNLHLYRKQISQTRHLQVNHHLCLSMCFSYGEVSREPKLSGTGDAAVLTEDLLRDV
jgi:hypothetical protein